MKWILIGTGIFFIGLSIFSKIQTAKILVKSVRTIGHIVDIIIESGPHMGRSVKVSFKTEKGQNFNFIHKYPIEVEKYQIGQAVEVYYVPENPKLAGLLEQDNNDAQLIIGVAMGIGVLIFGLYF
ncbi:MAG: DUF3592 domain-containing protein [Pyrinomonadaceae bacterium]|nr:DUF3592 domain-containing protein [Pyrinomonadaceae bacterium]